MVDPQFVVLVVAGSSPVGHPIPLPGSFLPISMPQLVVARPIVRNVRRNGYVLEKWSERQDSNLRRLGPKPSALARLSYAPSRSGVDYSLK